MKVVFHEDFYPVYTSDPAAAAGRMEAVVNAIKPHVKFITAEPAAPAEITAVHTEEHVQHVRESGLYPISSLAAGGAMMAAEIGQVCPMATIVEEHLAVVGGVNDDRVLEHAKDFEITEKAGQVVITIEDGAVIQPLKL